MSLRASSAIRTGFVMRVSSGLMLCILAILAVVLAALHAPGEMSVDSGMSLYEALKGSAVGWGPTFMSATLAWLGGGTIGASLFVALNCILTYACFAALLTSGRLASLPRWQVATAFLLSLNPLFMFYVGIIWKDVMLATVAMVTATLLLLAVDRNGRGRYLLLVFCLPLIGLMVPIRQQGILIAIPLAIAAGWLVARNVRGGLLGRVVVFACCLAFVVASNAVFHSLSAATVKPKAQDDVSVGIYTIQAYEIAGMIANAKPGDPASWSGATPAVQQEIKSHYSPERIDTIWGLEPIRNYFNKLSAEQYMSIWLRGIKHDPGAFVRSRFSAYASLLGMQSIDGCVPAFWGVSALPDQVAPLGLQNGMDARARLVGHTAIRLYGTPVFRNWFYSLLLLFVSAAALFRMKAEQRVAAISISIAAWLYLLSFLPTTIACDFRYLYPVACLSTLLCIHLLTRARLLSLRENNKSESANV